MRKNLETIKVQISCYLRNYYFSLNHPTGWAESISGIGLCMSVRHHFEYDHYFCS